MTTRTIIFDFDGTLADTKVVFFEILNQLAREYHRPEITIAEAQQLRDIHPLEVLKKYHISLLQLPLLLVRGRQIMYKKMSRVELNPDIKKTILALKKSKIKLGILTSNSVENVQALLSKSGIADAFSFVYSENSIFGKEKALKKVLIREKLQKEETMYVGDEVRDVEACHKCNLNCVAVSWGINGERILATSKPKWLIRQPLELLKIVCV